MSLTPFSRTVIQCYLDKFQSYLFIGMNNITVPLQKGNIWSGWLTAEEKFYTNASVPFLNFYNTILNTEGNECGTISIPVTETSFKNYSIRVLQDHAKGYIYRYFIVKLISSEATIQIIIWQTICVILSGGTERGRKENGSLVLPTTLYTPQTNHSLTLYWSNGNYEKACTIYAVTIHNFLQHFICQFMILDFKNLGHTHTRTFMAV